MAFTSTYSRHLSTRSSELTIILLLDKSIEAALSGFGPVAPKPLQTLQLISRGDG